MSTGTGIAYVDGSNNSYVDSNGLMIIFQQSQGRFLFLYNHYVDEEVIQAGETREMFYPWTPTADVEPLDATAVASFYAAGPTLGAVIRTQWQQLPVRRPVTFWYQIDADLWALSGLGSNQSIYPPILAYIGRIE